MTLAPRFLADAMLGRLARWLRVVGCDTLYLPTETPDAELVAVAAREGRVLLTRDRHLLRELRPVQALAIRGDAPLAQVREVVEAFALAAPDELLGRCLLCNTPLHHADPATMGERLPPSARDLPGPIRACPTCGRIYWRGSHARRMEAALERALPGWRRSG